MNNQILNTSSTLLFSVIMLAVIFSLLTTNNYRQSNRQVLEQSTEYPSLSYVDLYQILRGEGMTDNVVLIDLRPAEDFKKSHLPNAINIPSEELLNRKHRRTLRTKKNLLLYAGSEHIAVAAQTILLAKGMDNVKAIPGNHHGIKEHILDGFDPSRAYFHEDKARWDHQRFMPLGTVAR